MKTDTNRLYKLRDATAHIHDNIARKSDVIHKEKRAQLVKEIGFDGGMGCYLIYEAEDGRNYETSLWDYQKGDRCRKVIKDAVEQIEKELFEAFCSENGLTPGQKIEQEALVPTYQVFGVPPGYFYGRGGFGNGISTPEYKMKVFVTYTLTHETLLKSVNSENDLHIDDKLIEDYLTRFEQRVDTLEETLTNRFLSEYTDWLEEKLPKCKEYLLKQKSEHERKIAENRAWLDKCEKAGSVKKARAEKREEKKLRELAKKFGLALPNELKVVEDKDNG